MSVILISILGIIIGFLLNYFSDVLPAFHRLTKPVCTTCKQPFTLKEYLLLSKCSKCGCKRSKRSVIVLICSLASSLLLYYFPFSLLNYWATLPMLILLGTILIIDIEHRVVLTLTSAFGFIMFLIYGIFIRGLSGALLGSLGGFLIMFLFYILGIVFNKVLGKLQHKDINEVAFGFGDVSIGTILGLLTGWPAILGVIIIAILAFAAYAVVLFTQLLLSKKYKAFSKALPFTPFLIIGLVVMFYL